MCEWLSLKTVQALNTNTRRGEDASISLHQVTPSPYEGTLECMPEPQPDAFKTHRGGLSVRREYPVVPWKINAKGVMTTCTS
jgi:hypothetical protein